MLEQESWTVCVHAAPPLGALTMQNVSTSRESPDAVSVTRTHGQDARMLGRHLPPEQVSRRCTSHPLVELLRLGGLMVAPASK